MFCINDFIERAAWRGQALPGVPSPADGGGKGEGTRTGETGQWRGGEDVAETSPPMAAGEAGQKETAAGRYGGTRCADSGEM